MSEIRRDISCENMEILKNKWIILVFILTVSGIIIFTDFLVRPAIWSDEGLVVQLARNFSETGDYNIAVAPGVFSGNRHYYTSSVGWVMPVSLAMVFEAFGVSFLNGRLLAAFYFFGFIIVSFLLAHRLWGLKIAAISSFLLVTFAPLYGNGKPAIAEVPALFWLALGFYFYEIFRQKPTQQMIFSGIGFGLFFASKPAFLLLGLPALFLIHLIDFLRDKESLRKLAAFWPVVFIVVLPTIWLGIIHPINFSNIKKAVAHYSNNYGSPCVLCDIKNNLSAFLSSETLWHLFLLSVVAVVYLIFINRKILLEDWRLKWLMLFGFFDILFFLKSPGVFRYFFPFQIILLAAFPICFLGIVKRARENLSGAAFFLLVVLGVFQFLHLALSPTSYYSAVYSVGPVDMEKYLSDKKFPKNATIGIIDMPQAGASMAAGRYYQLIQFATGKNFGISDGINVLDLPDNLLPDYLLYKRPFFLLSGNAGEYEKKIENHYKKIAIFYEQIRLMKKN